MTKSKTPKTKVATTSKITTTNKPVTKAVVPKKPTLKEQLATLQSAYTEQSIDYQKLLDESSQKDMQIANLTQEVRTLEGMLAASQEKRLRLYDEMDLIKSAPWYTKFINFLKGD